MGRNAAGESFLRGFLEHSSSDTVWVYVEQLEHARAFNELHKQRCEGKEVKFLGPAKLGDLSIAGCLFYPGPNLKQLSLNRQPFGSTSWSLCGITHTTASQHAMSSIVDIISSPLEAWDVLICPSTAVKGHVEVLLEEQTKFLKDHLGVKHIGYPEMPVIPLGVHAEDFNSSAEEKSTARSRLEIKEDEIAVLYAGRLSFHAKAHPLAMYQALEVASRETKKKIVLIESGWHGNDHIKEAFREGAEFACPSVRVIQLDGRNPVERKHGWASADIFCSLADNIQETFGIVPIEAMAAGLPVVVSDWDGYRDTVREGLDGFRIPTIMPPEGLGEDLALRHALGLDSYDRYCGNTSSLVSVDIDAAAAAFVQLFNSEGLRKEMGTSGRRRAEREYDWRGIIPKYEDLWARVREIRLSAARRGTDKKSSRVSDRLDPFYAFKGYPTTQLGMEQRLVLRQSDLPTAMKQLERVNTLAMVNFAAYITPSKEESSALLRLFSDEAKTVAEVLPHFPTDKRRHMHRVLVWFLKLGILKVL